MTGKSKEIIIGGTRTSDLAVEGILRRYSGMPDVCRTVEALRERNHGPAVTDREDSIEDALRISAAVNVVGEDHVWLEHGFHQITRLSDSTAWSIHEMVGDSSREAYRFGGIPSDFSGITFKKSPETDYASSDAFMDNAARLYTVIPVSQESITEAESAIIRWSRAHGVNHILIKKVGGKHPLLDAVVSPTGVTGIEMSFLEWAFTSTVHRDIEIMVQEFVDVNFEYRCFTQDGEIITAAGNVENFTPCDGSGPFDDRMEKRRGSGIVTTEHDLAETLRDFASDVALDLFYEKRTSDFVCLDVAWNATSDTPMVVELNPVGSSGFYACDPIGTRYCERMIADMISDSENALYDITSSIRK